MKPLFHTLGATPLFLFWATAAQATFGCDVMPLPEGFIKLHETPDAASPVVLNVPVGANVSDMSRDGGVQGAWIQVAYSADPKAYWGEGQIGWVLSEQLGNCG